MRRSYLRQNAKARSNNLEMQNCDQTVEPNAYWYLHVVTLTRIIARTIGRFWIPRPLRHPWFSGRLGSEALGTNDTDHLAPFLKASCTRTCLQTLCLFSLRYKKKSRENKLLCWFIEKIILCTRWKVLYNSLARVRGEGRKKTRIPLALIPHLSPHYCVTRCLIDLPTFHVLIYQLYSCLLSKSKARVICACPTKQGKVFKSL